MNSQDAPTALRVLSHARPFLALLAGIALLAIGYFVGVSLQHQTETDTGALSPSPLSVSNVSVAEGVDGTRCVAGSFLGFLNFGDQPLQSEGDQDIFVARLRAGKVEWTQRFGGALRDEASDVAIRADGACVIVGSFAGELSLGDQRLKASPGDRAAFVATVLEPTTVVDARRLADHLPAGARLGVSLDRQERPVIALSVSAKTEIGPVPHEEGLALINGDGTTDFFATASSCFDLCSARDNAAVPSNWSNICGGGPGTDCAKHLCPKPPPHGGYQYPSCCQASGLSFSDWDYTSSCVDYARHNCASSVCSPGMRHRSGEGLQ